MTNPLPARNHANASVAERELTFDALLAEFEVKDEREVAIAAPHSEGLLAAEAIPESRTKPAARWLPLPSTPVLQFIGIGLLFAASLTLVIVALSR